MALSTAVYARCVQAGIFDVGFRLLLVELYHFNRNTAVLKYLYYDILTEFYNIILATKQQFIPFIVIRFVNIWDPTMCTSTECTSNIVCELA